MSELTRYATIEEMATYLRSGTVTASELAEEAISLSLSEGEQHTAIASVLSERALRTAEKADKRLRSRRTSTLTGIPYGAKDIISAVGGPTSWGVPSFLDRESVEDATTVARLEHRSAPLIAKLVTTSVAGGGGHSIPGIAAQGQPRNPWNPSHFAGSSSSGSAIAVALGIVPFALGSETGGSVIHPAAHCGVTGYRPSFGLIPRTGMMQLSPRLDKVGIIARSAEDCRHVLSVLAGPDRVDRYSGSVRLRKPLHEGAIRIGQSEREMEGLDLATQKVIKEGLQEFTDAVGHRVITEISADHPYGQALELIIRVDAAVCLAPHLADPNFILADPFQQRQLMTAHDVSATDYARMDQVRDRARWEFEQVFDKVDVLVSASYPTEPQLRSDPRRPRSMATVSERLLAAANLAGLPGLSIPCGLNEHGFPVGLHLVGPRGSDRGLLGVASAYQRLSSHHRRRPPGSSSTGSSEVLP